MTPFFSHATVFVLLLILLNPAAGLAGNFYQPEASIEILTILKNCEIPGQTLPKQRFTVGPVKNSSRPVRVDFFRKGSGQSAGSLNFFSSNSDVSWESPGISGKLLKAEYLLLIPGAPIPMNVLPVKRFLSGSEPLTYEIRCQAGGRTFVNRIRISSRAVSGGAAGEAGWLRTLQDAPPELVLIEAVDLSSDELIARQLWAPGSVWWLYEETPFRRSWRIP